jgi:hypothetical protein
MMDHKTLHGLHLRAFTARDRGSIYYLAHDDVPMTTNGDDISIRSTEEMEKYKSLHP